MGEGHTAMFFSSYQITAIRLKNFLYPKKKNPTIEKERTRGKKQKINQSHYH
jgi:hypothetical protein